jgi:cell division protein FtsZ
MTNRRTDEDRPDPVTELAAWLRRDGLTEVEIQKLVVKMGKMVAGSAMAEGDKRAVRAARAAISQLPADASITEARGIMVDVAGAGNLTKGEIDAAAEAVHRAAHPDAEILFSGRRDEKMAEAVRVTVIAVQLEST